MSKLHIALLVVVAAATAGCVERKMTITSEPSGALVYVSDREVGRTPVTIPFTWYGDYDIVLRRDGYNTLTTHAKICPPAYEVPPLDLFSAIAPWTYHDNRYLHYRLCQTPPTTDADLIRRADEMRGKTVSPGK